MLKDIPDVSDDLIVRIVGSERWTGMQINVETLNGCPAFVKMKGQFMCFAIGERMTCF